MNFVKEVIKEKICEVPKGFVTDALYNYKLGIVLGTVITIALYARLYIACKVDDLARKAMVDEDGQMQKELSKAF